MDADDAVELAAWLKFVHPDVLDEFRTAKKTDPGFSDIPPSQEYFAVKKEIDDLINSSNYEFSQRAYNSQFKNQIGYYYQGQLVFVYDCTCIEGGRMPHFTYWDDFFVRDNSYKERCGSNPDCHYAYTEKSILKIVTNILQQIAEHNA